MDALKIGIFSAALGLAAVAEASDGKTYSTISCDVVSGQAKYRGTIIENPSTTEWLKVRCPIVRDNVTHSPSGFFMIAWDDHHYSGHDVKCELRSSGGGGLRVNSITSFGYPGAWQKYDKQLSVTTMSERVSHILVCDIPPAWNQYTSGLLGFGVTE